MRILKYARPSEDVEVLELYESWTKMNPGSEDPAVEMMISNQQYSCSYKLDKFDLVRLIDDLQDLLVKMEEWSDKKEG